MTEEMYHSIMGVETEDMTSRTGTDSEKLLQSVFSEVLNIKREQVSLDKSFLGVGGDSISAMQVIALCQDRGKAISVQAILRSKSISELALQLRKVQGGLDLATEVFDTTFELSPVQQMFFQTNPSPRSEGHYNQSFLLQIKQKLTADILAQSIDAIARQHSILRAHFTRSTDGLWSQQIPEGVPQNRVLFSGHNVEHIQDAISTIKATHAAINFESGPIFAAALFDTTQDGQYLFMVAHHLVIDLVSWRIIMQDLEKLIKLEPLASPGIPWQTWLMLQQDHASKELDPETVLPYEIPLANLGYWGMEGIPNKAGDTIEQVASLSLKETTDLLNPSCHTALRSEPIDILLGSLLHAFALTFTDRDVPALFREGHGREPWNDHIDLSQTVGWFTTMYPFYIANHDTEDLLNTILQAKDLRHEVPANGWQYFASRFLNAAGWEKFSAHDNVEVTFDYLGLYQQLEREDALFCLAPRDHNVVFNVGSEIQRFMLIEITAEVVDGRMQFQFLYNKHVRHQKEISKWISRLLETIKHVISLLVVAEQRFSPSDFPLMSYNYSELTELVETRLPQHGINKQNVEDIYPCTPMQRGLLLSQLKTAGTYEYYHEMEVMPSALNEPFHLDQLCKAWGAVVSCHPVLRTVFLESLHPEQVYDQVVLKEFDAWIEQFICPSEECSASLAHQLPVTVHLGRPPHRFSVCTTPSGRIFCRLEINHAIADGASISVILRDLVQAYDSTELPSVRPFSHYVDYIQRSSQKSALKYWEGYLKDLTPCNIDCGVQQTGVAERKWDTTTVQLGGDFDKMRLVCEEYGVTISNILQAAWALVLRQYTNLDDVVFGYLTSGRDAPMADFESSAGPYLTMIICRQQLQSDKSLYNVAEATRDDFASALPNQFCSLADIQHALHLAEVPLFNTVFSLQKVEDLPTQVHKGSRIQVNLLNQHDPTEVSIYHPPKRQLGATLTIEIV